MKALNMKPYYPPNQEERNNCGIQNTEQMYTFPPKHDASTDSFHDHLNSSDDGGDSHTSSVDSVSSSSPPISTCNEYCKCSLMDGMFSPPKNKLKKTANHIFKGNIAAVTTSMDTQKREIKFFDIKKKVRKKVRRVDQLMPYETILRFETVPVDSRTNMNTSKSNLTNNNVPLAPMIHESSPPETTKTSRRPPRYSISIQELLN
ncbi:hypothetical protein C9374_003625 [Naegleria lovaniensis]|uniref:Uncharacterized protein n=1 Tax=Naegleria lovaniensis TaxID=51637 RepID=A0AA88KS43_NAELO|nr:uncharacterized protein C9374_003625 [Naegleria lovaniensis]KAG2393861.1 hypothetical protein C9374_003625 [Naegleria lovaniensis]